MVNYKNESKANEETSTSETLSEKKEPNDDTVKKTTANVIVHNTCNKETENDSQVLNSSLTDSKGVSKNKLSEDKDPAIIQNKFVNDGSFLSMILEQQKKNKIMQDISSCLPIDKDISNSLHESKVETACSQNIDSAQNHLDHSHLKRKTKDKVDVSSQKKQRHTKIEDIQHAEEEDPLVAQAKKEFIHAMEIMEEAGLVTEKGIGSGMVK